MTNKKKTKERSISTAPNSESRYASFLETISHGIQENDPSGIITFSNAAHHAMLGYAEGELIGKAIWDIQPSESEGDKLRTYLAQLVKDQPPPTPFIAQNRKKDGRLIDTQVDWNYIRDDRGILIGFISVISDITDRKHAEQAMCESEERFRNAFENAPIGMAIVGLDERFLQVNQALCTILGYSREALLATTVPAVTHPDDRSMEVDQKQQARDGSVQNFQMEKRYLHADGHVVWGNLSVSLVQDNGGKSLYYIGQLEDVTGRRQAENRLKKQVNRTEQILQTTLDGYILADVTGRLIDVNPAYCRMIGYTRDELLQMNIKDLEATRSAAEIKETIEHMVQHGSGHFQTSHRRKDGVLIDLDVSSSIFQTDTSPLVAAFVRDITDQNQVKEALRESEERFRGAFEAAAHGMALVAPDGRWLKVNRSFCRLVGYTEEELLATDFQTLTHPDDLEADLQLAQKLLAGEVPSFQMEKRYIHKGGHAVWILLSVSLVRDAEGRPLHFVAQIQDISERKKVEESLQRNEKTLQKAQRIAQLGRWDWDINANRATLSEDLVRMFGLQPQEHISYEDFLGIIHPDDVDHVKKAIEDAVYKSKAFSTDYRIIRPDGTEKAIHSEGEVYDDDAGKPASMFGIAQDISDRKKLEAQLLQAQKMEAVGQLAGGIAHDFNNILTAIMGYGNFLQMRMEKDSPLRPQVDSILASAERAAQLTHSLLAFSRKQVILPAPVEVNGIVSRVVKLLAHLIGEDIDITKVLSHEEMIIMADAGQLEHVLMNLATNARDAMPDGGTLIIETRPAILDDEYVKAHGYGEPGQYAVLSITDTGAGMDEATKNRIFEPFFTTKESGRGTGLGLAMVYGIIKQHRGHITVYSEPGKGTTFTIYLPRVASEVMVAQPEETRTPPRGAETILVGEDDAAVRTLVRTVLEEFGYTVITAVDGEDTIRKFREQGETIQLLLLDVIMPGKNGKEAYEEIRKLKPDVKVLFTSGYTADLIQKKGVLDGEINLVYKPVSPTELLIKIRDVLDA